MQRKFAKLIDVKSIVTLSITLVFCILSLMQKIDEERLVNILQIIIAFYFGTQHEKNKGGEQNER